jgi:hypothetical protein
MVEAVNRLSIQTVQAAFSQWLANSGGADSNFLGSVIRCRYSE